jgi:hypothetical protein
VEELFNAVQLLAERDDLEVTPFVGAWDEMVDKLDRTTASTPDVKVRDIAENLSYFFQSHDRYRDNYKLERVFEAFARRILETVKQQQSSSGEGQVFKETNQKMLRILKKLVWITNADKVAYLKPLLNVLQEQQDIAIATLNYDNAIELLTKTHSVNCETGIEEWLKSGTFTLGTSGIQLIKLHGSIDWARDYKVETSTDADKTGMPRYVLTIISPDNIEKEGYKPAVIFGQRNKLTTEGPFLELLRVFRTKLFAAERLTVIGYSFRDPHVNEYIWQWMSSTNNNQLRIIDPVFKRRHRYWPKNFKPEYGQLLGDEFIAHLLRHCTMRVKEIAANAGEGLAQIFTTA